MADKNPVSGAEQRVLARLARVLGGSERELRYQLEHKDQHPLDRGQLLALLDELEARGLIVSALRFRLTPAGRALVRDLEALEAEFIVR
jgi:DNA-binding PadR family transcriptional regulator